jgi:hypothetical protein
MQWVKDQLITPFQEMHKRQLISQVVNLGELYEWQSAQRQVVNAMQVGSRGGVG